MQTRFKPRPGAQPGRRRATRRVTAVVAACSIATGAAILVAAPAQAASTVSGGAPVYADVWQGGYRGWTTGGLTMLCWKDGSWANGTNRWFAIYAGSISGFVNANLVTNQSTVPHCSG